MNRREFLAGAVALAVRSPGLRLRAQTRVYGSPLPERAKLLAAVGDLAALGCRGFETNYRSVEHGYSSGAEFPIGLIGLHINSPAQAAGMARLAKALGGSQVVCSGIHAPADLNRAGSACRELGITFAIHNHAAELEQDGRALRAMLDETNAGLVSLVLDVGNPFAAGFTAPAVVRRYFRRIAGFHLRDTSAGVEVLMGAGEFDFAGLARVIREVGWTGWLILEVNRRADIPSRQLAEMSLDHIRKTMGVS